MAFDMANRTKIIDGVSNLDNFVIGDVRGAWYPDVTGLDTGKLDPDWKREFRQATGITYVVWSYATPIAWRTAGAQWVVPDVRYSNTTARHLSLVRQGIKARDERIAKAIADCGC